MGAGRGEETATAYHRHTYDFAAVDVIVLEGIYLLKRRLQARYDLSIWIDCTVETALARAVARGQEAASAIVTNDPRLESALTGAGPHPAGRHVQGAGSRP
jgi:pantothenate kinase